MLEIKHHNFIIYFQKIFSKLRLSKIIFFLEFFYLIFILFYPFLFAQHDEALQENIAERLGRKHKEVNLCILSKTPF
jgi:hypothetical protein